MMVQKLFGASFFIAPIALDCVLRPITASDRKIGSDRMKEQRIYMNMNAAPPYSPTI